MSGKMDVEYLVKNTVHKVVDGVFAVAQYEMGTIVKILVNTKMNVKNLNAEVLELIGLRC